MPLSQSERDTADDLFASAKFGDIAQRKSAQTALDSWTGGDSERLAHIAGLEAANRAVEINVGTLRNRYPRHIESREPAAAAIARAPRLSRFWPGIAMACCAMVAAATWVINPVLSHQNTSSAVGQQLAFDLDDGSRVLLNTDTAVRFVNRLHSRELTLEKGEAMFSVVHSSVRPFHVYAGTADIRDVGTQFSVRLLPTGVSVAVLEGQVSVTPSADTPPALLTANEAVRTDGATMVPVNGAQAVDAMLSWKDQRLDFDNTSIVDVIGDLQRYRLKPIVLADNKAGKFRVSGGFSIADPEQLLKTLPSVAPVTVTMKPDGTAVIASRH